MVPYTPEELQEEILEKYGALVPLDEIYSYNEDDPFLNADDIYDLHFSYNMQIEQPKGKLISTPRGFTSININAVELPKIPSACGNYIWLLKENCIFPQIEGMCTPTFNRIKHQGKELRVMYTGKAADLRNRLLKNHINGKIATSTLRKSLAALFGFHFEIYLSGKTKKCRITQDQEAFISNWLCKNCILLFRTDTNYSNAEIDLIKKLDPPLNIEDNPNINNYQYAAQLSVLRSNASSFSQTRVKQTLNHNIPSTPDWLHDLKIIGIILFVIIVLLFALLSN